MTIKRMRTLWMIQAWCGIIITIALAVYSAMSYITGEWTNGLAFLILFILWIRAGLHKPDDEYPQEEKQRD